MARRASGWPDRVGPAAAVAASGYAGVLAAAAIAGHDRFVGVPAAAWPAVAVLGAGAVAAAVRPIAVVLWTVAGLALAGSCWVLLSLIELAVTGTVDDPVTFVERLGLVAIAALFTATAVAGRRRARGTCARCGRAHPPGPAERRHPEPHPAPAAVRRLAYAGSALFLPYLVLHILGAAGVPGIEPHGFRPPWSAIAAGVVGVGLAVFLLLGLVSPWGMVFPQWTVWLAGRRVPRFLPLTPVWLVAPTLALYGTGSLVYAFFTDDGVLGLGGAASVAFGGYGWALTVAAVSYQSRTRPACVPGQPAVYGLPGQ